MSLLKCSNKERKTITSNLSFVDDYVLETGCRL